MKFVIVAMATSALAGCAMVSSELNDSKPAGTSSPRTATLEGGPWIVEDINGSGIIDNARADVTFDASNDGSGVVYGRTGCNRYRGGWKQDGATVKFGPLAATMMACAPAQMDLEKTFIGTLEAVTNLSFDATGAALLKAPDGRVIKMRKEAKPG